MAENVETKPSVEPVRKQIVVPLSQPDAFRLFTDEIGSWWPLETHSVAGDDAVGCEFEPYPGGRIYERASNGSIHTWGTVEAWDAPNLIAMSWHPGRTPQMAQRLEVTFVPVEEGTRLDLVHTGWERLGESATAERGRYHTGWDMVLGRFSKAAI